MYDKEIKRVGELVYGPERYTIGLAIHKVANEYGISVSVLAQALRGRKTMKDGAKSARRKYRTTVPNRMITHLIER